MKFRNLALFTTSLVALGLAVAPASAKTAPMMGRVDIDFSYWWDSWDYSGGSGYDDEYTTVVGSARVNIPYDEVVNLQLDISGETSLGEYSYGQAGHFVAGGHLNWRDPMVGLLGVFVATGRAGGSLYGGSTAMVGVEGQYYCDLWTFYGQIGYWDSDESQGYAIQNAGFIRGEVNYYASPQLKLTAGLKYIDGQSYDYYAEDRASDSHGWDWLVRGDYWFGKSIPVAAFGEIAGRTNDSSYGGTDTNLDVWRVNLGLTFYFGSDGNNDLKYQDRNGASVSLPDLDEARTSNGSD